MGIFTREEFESIIHDNKILDDTGATFVVVDKDLQILYVNYTANEREGKFSPGDLLECSNAVSASNGCGSHESCKECKLREVVEKSMNTNTKMEADANLLVKGNTDYSVHAVSTPFMHEGKEYAVVLLIDRTDQHRELMMERIFFHDLLNLSGALNGILECTQNDDPKETIGIVREISNRLLDEIMAQRDFMYAKKGILEPKMKRIKASQEMDFVRNSLVSSVKDMWGVTLEVESTLTDEEIEVDPGLACRVLHNMVKNACEASRNTVVKVKGWSTDDKVIFSVHNDGVMTSEVKSKVFLYGNTTKEGFGRGLGTYSMKLIGENYLHGKVWFKSEEGFGTEFYFELDKA